jgi:hypothetical protein
MRLPLLPLDSYGADGADDVERALLALRAAS